MKLEIARIVEERMKKLHEMWKDAERNRATLDDQIKSVPEEPGKK
ncbi:MAG: hypothetical protein WBE38_02375 [Terracidiphilus sp.]|jgi:hypothetical protein